MKRRTFRIFAALLIELSTSIVCIFLFLNVCVSEQSDIRSLWIRSFLGIDHQFMSICFGFIFCDLIFVIFFSPHILIAEKNLGEQIMRKKIKILYAQSIQTLCGVIQIKMSRNYFLLKSKRQKLTKQKI